VTTPGEGLPDGPETELRDIDDNEAAPPTAHPRTGEEQAEENREVDPPT
jgi:hypothetical protein